MKKYRVVFQDKDGLWKPCFDKDSSRQTAKRRQEALYLQYAGPFEIQEVAYRAFCPHCKNPISTELETEEITKLINSGDER